MMRVRDEINFNNMKLTIRELSTKDLGDIELLFNKATDYFLMVDKKLPDDKIINGILTDVPPSKTLEDKYILGIYSGLGNQLIALVDILKDYYKAGEWMVGLLITDENQRRQGLGSGIHEFVKDWIRGQGGYLLRVGVLEINKKALEFWSSIGYRESRRVNMEFGGVDEVVIVMELSLVDDKQI